MRVFFYRSLIVLIIALTGIGLYQMMNISSTYANEERIAELVSEFAPPMMDISNVRSYQENLHGTGVSNPTLLEAKNNINEDIVGWLRLPDTRIDYPIVQGTDNNFYVYHDIQRQPSAAGTIFIDRRNNENFADFNTVIYGHNMLNGSMFADLENFGDAGYFYNNPVGSLFLINTTYILEIFAYLRIHHDDRIIYGSKSYENFQEFIDYVRTVATNFRDVQLSGEDRFVTLSTCDNDFPNYRFVVLARLKNMDYN